MTNLTTNEEDSIFDSLMLMDVIQDLTVKQRVVVALRSAGYSQLEAGKILGMTRAAIGIIFKRAIQAIRIKIKDY